MDWLLLLVAGTGCWYWLLVLVARGSGFRRLEVGELAHALTLDLYRETRRFPTDERFGLVRPATSNQHQQPVPATSTSNQLLVSQRVYRVQPRRPHRREHPEDHACNRAGAECGDDRQRRNRCLYWRDLSNEHGNAGAEDQSDDGADRRQRHGFDEELPEDRAARRAKCLSHADLTRPFGDRNHHDRDDAHAADEQADRREHDHDQEEHPKDLVVRLEELV